MKKQKHDLEVKIVADYCENCGKNITPGTKFCPDCGAKIEKATHEVSNDINHCPNCGEKVEHDESFCENCGANLKTLEPTQHVSFFKKYKTPIIIIAVIAVIAIVLISAIALLPTKPADVGTRSVTVGTERFTIPGDYKIDPSTIDVKYTGYNAVFAQGYSNGEEIIYISVMNIPPGVDGQEVVSSQGGVQKNLLGTTGYYTEDSEGVYTFAFVSGAYIDIVTVTSPYVLDQITYSG